jgi:phosphoribosylamine--glycine ligase
MKEHGAATADFWLPADMEEVKKTAAEHDGQLVVKYDGLAAGKGVFVCSSEKDVINAFTTIKERYGEDAQVLIEEKLKGQELSIIGICDGKVIKMLQPSQDHKAIFDGDKGPNTGGMGAYCPVPFCSDELLAQIQKDVVEPTLDGLRAEGIDYKGVIYFGLMITEDGPKVLEYNVRFGDPETEVILPALKSDLLQVILASLNGRLAGIDLEFNSGYFVDVVLAAGGYPGVYDKGLEITGLDKVDEKAVVFHAGTKLEGRRVLTSGGRVLNVAASGPTLQEAIDTVYKECAKIYFDDVYYRGDIAKKGLAQ